MSVMTVLGPVEAYELGIVLPHEHCLIDLRCVFSEADEISKKVIADQQVSMHNLSFLRTNPHGIKDNLLLSDVDLARQELEKFRKAGGATIVDLTSRGIGRDSYLLRSLAMSTDLNIIAGCGYYTYDTHPPEIDKKPVEALTDEIIENLTIGIKKSGVRAGVIGELGTSKEIHPNEKKVLLAAAEAHNKTGAPIFVHIYPWAPNGVEVVNILSEQGVHLDKIVICHSDLCINTEYIKDVLSTGALVVFDNFGKEHYIIPEDRTDFYGGTWSTDRERVKVLKLLIDEGFETQILISSDICRKTDLHYYGGPGYDHILRNIIPMAIEEGVNKATIDLFLKENPQKLLDIT